MWKHAHAWPHECSASSVRSGHTFSLADWQRLPCERGLIDRGAAASDRAVHWDAIARQDRQEVT